MSSHKPIPMTDKPAASPPAPLSPAGREELIAELLKGADDRCCLDCCYGETMKRAAAMLSAAPSSNGMREALLVKGIQDYLDGNYGPKILRKIDKCPHGQFGYEACENCIDQHFIDLLAALPPAPVSDYGMREALEPFAKEAARFDEIPGVCIIGDDVEIWQKGNYQCPISVGDLRRARDAAAALPPAPVGDVTAEQVREIDKLVAPEFETGYWETIESENKIPENPVVGSEQWRPIETAPKDGTPIWMWSPEQEFGGANQFVGQWSEMHGWWIDEGDTRDLSECPATHWMPLPAPPPSNDGPRSGEGEIGIQISDGLREAIRRLRFRLEDYCNRANAGYVPAGGREFMRRVQSGFDGLYKEAEEIDSGGISK